MAILTEKWFTKGFLRPIGMEKGDIDTVNPEILRVSIWLVVSNILIFTYIWK